MRQRISSPSINIRILFLIFALIFSTLSLLTFIKFLNLSFTYGFELAFTDFKTEPIILSLFFFFLYKINRKRPVVEFDNEFLYIVNKETEVKVELRNINLIKKPLVQFNNYNTWIIKYMDSEGLEKKLKVNTTFRWKRFQEFRNQVKLANRKVEINGY